MGDTDEGKNGGLDERLLKSAREMAALIAAVWQKGHVIPGFDPATFRQDACGAWIIFSHHGNRDSDFGWEIDHIVPAGEDEEEDSSLDNLQPLQWRNNTAKRDGSLRCAVTADGDHNRLI